MTVDSLPQFILFFNALESILSQFKQLPKHTIIESLKIFIIEQSSDDDSNTDNSNSKIDTDTHDAREMLKSYLQKKSIENF